MFVIVDRTKIVVQVVNALKKFHEGICRFFKIVTERICEVSSGNHAMCLLLEITIIFRDSDIQIFLNGDVLLNGS